MSNSISQEQKNIFAHNLNKLLSENGKTQSDLVTHFGITASTVSDWCNAKKFPRVDKIQQLADYFGVKKSNLIEENNSEQVVDPDMRRIERARSKMSAQEKYEMMEILKISFKKFFTDDFVDTTDYSDENED